MDRKKLFSCPLISQSFIVVIVIFSNMHIREKIERNILLALGLGKIALRLVITHI